ASATATTVESWEHHYEFRPGKWTQRDYNFETPSANLQATAPTIVPLPDAKKYEMFDYPGEYAVVADGERLTKLRMAEDEIPFDAVTGSGACCTFTPGAKFTLQDHDVDSENGKKYVVSSVRHEAYDASYGATAMAGSYSNTFTCLPANVTYRAPRS